MVQHGSAGVSKDEGHKTSQAFCAAPGAPGNFRSLPIQPWSEVRSTQAAKQKQHGLKASGFGVISIYFVFSIFQPCFAFNHGTKQIWKGTYCYEFAMYCACTKLYKAFDAYLSRHRTSRVRVI